jgi:hypothetical protein
MRFTFLYGLEKKRWLDRSPTDWNAGGSPATPRSGVNRLPTDEFGFFTLRTHAGEPPGFQLVDRKKEAALFQAASGEIGKFIN